MKLDSESVKKLLLALLASTKGSYSLNELNADFRDMNGTDIPFREMGFKSLVEYLQSEPSMFRVSKGMNNQYEVSPVIDETLSSLRRLVSGQKSTSKKSKKKKTSTSYYSSSYNNNSTRKYAPVMTRPNYQHSTTLKKPGYWGESQQQNVASQPVKTMTSTVLKRVVNYHVQSTIKTANSQTNTPPLMPKIEIKTSSPQSVDSSVQSLWITNASYFLTEYEVKITHVVKCDTVFLRLIGPDFSQKYEEMQREMEEFYDRQGDKYRGKDLEVNSMAVVFDKSDCKYHRVKIEKIKDKQITCYFLDLGKQAVFDANDVYMLVDQFLKIRFQAIQVQLSQFNQFFHSSYLMSQLEKAILDKNFICRRTLTNPLTVALFDKTNKSITEEFLNKNRCFVTRQLHVNMEFSGPITYIDETSLLTYVHIENSSTFMNLMDQMNKYYETTKNTQIGKVLNEAIRSKLQDAEFRENSFFAAIYYVDQRWYRVKYVREVSANDTIQVSFVDFGNKETVSLTDLMLIPPEFIVFANLPPQAMPVSFMHSCFDLDLLKEYWFDTKSIKLKVLRFNSVDLPTVEIVADSMKERKPKPVSPVKQEENKIVLDKEESKKKLIEILETQPIESNLIQVKEKTDSKATIGTKHRQVVLQPAQILTQTPSTPQINNGLSNGITASYKDTQTQPKAFKIVVNNNLSNINNQIMSSMNNLSLKESLPVKNSQLIKPSYGNDENAVLTRSTDELELVKKLESFHFGPKNLNDLYARSKKIEPHQLPHISVVYISNAAHPGDLKLNIIEHKESYESLFKDMEKFYRGNPEEYLATEVKLDGVYASVNGKGVWRRVRVVSKMFDDMAKLYDIDQGTFDVKTKHDKLYYLKKEFIAYKALAIKAKLANIKSDLPNDKWSKSATDYFAKRFPKKQLDSVTKGFDATDSTYTVELFDENGSVADQLIQHKLALPLIN